MTPMMLQYLEIKNQYRDYILFYRLGDFYEMFFEDAKIVSGELDLTLTGRDCGEAERAPMCGVPFHSYEPYLKRLVDKGYKIAVCEQTEDPAQAKGLVKREVVRIVTPGTVTDDTMLDSGKNNYLSALALRGEAAAVCFCDMASGQIYATYFEHRDPKALGAKVVNELAAYEPTELLSDGKLADYPRISEFLKGSQCLLNLNTEEEFDPRSSRAALEDYADVSRELALHESAPLRLAVGALIAYLIKTQKRERVKINGLTVYHENHFLCIDASSRKSLELCETMRTGERRGSLLSIIDKTKTAVGARLIKQWLEKPLMNCRQIKNRQDAVDALFSATAVRDQLREALSGTQDLERLLTKVLYGNPSARDLKAIQLSLDKIPYITRAVANSAAEELKGLFDLLAGERSVRLSHLASHINDAIVNEPPFSVREGGMLRDGFDGEIDELRSIIKESRDYLLGIETAEREMTGIKTLKIGYNKVFGYFIEVTRSYTDQVPDRYIRKQTLSGCERYITEELKDLEAKILGGRERITALEYELFLKVADAVKECADPIREACGAIAKLDVYASLALTAFENRYCRPEVDYSDVLILQDARHPIVEKYTDGFFVPNDTYLDGKDNRAAIITGPNMAGKSTYMRQVALIVILAQMGGFVPAKSARIGMVDKIFTRVGASDDLASGQSTFMIEMNEVAYILNNATPQSLILYDEVGRGTSTFDGMSIAKAVLEYTADKIKGAKTLFATHYHELSSLEGVVDGVKNYNIAAKKKGEEIIFLRKILRGAVDDSYGIEVARLAGLPGEVIGKAKKILKTLEVNRLVPDQAEREGDGLPEEITTDTVLKEEILEKLRLLDVNSLSPYEAMSYLYDLKKTAEGK